MGAYLSEPILDKHSSDEISACLSYGASSMQGWRVNQEDAHNAIIDYAKGKSLFAVYDGHGGHEVAAWCSLKLPDYLKTNENFQKGNYKEALEEAFIAFDATLVDRAVVAELKKIAGTKEDEAEEEDDGAEGDEVHNLFEDASMPIEDVLNKYNSPSAKKDPEDSSSKNGEAVESPSASKPVNPAIAAMRKEKKPVSPFLRGKNSPVDMEGVTANKHIRFNEDGSVENSGVKEETAEENSDDKENVKSESKSDAETKTETKIEAEAPKTPNGGTNGKPEVEDSPEGSEKENKDANAKSETNGDIIDDEGNIVKGKAKGKGKGKGKGKSKGKTEDPEPEEKERKPKKSANEIYETLLKAEGEEGDEDSDDSDDMEFGEAEGLDEEDSDEEGEDDLEGEEDSEDSDVDDNDEEDDEEGYEVEADFTEEPGNDSGCTAVVAMLAGTTLYVANAGDSRCVVCRDGKAVEMSFDHKPEDEPEMKRIKNAGGKVTPDGRVNGGLNLSRAIGDHAYKQNKSLGLPDQMISPQPDIKTHEIDPAKDSWMILACDGIWNFMSNQEVVDYINPRIETTPQDKLSLICEELFDHCLAPDTMGDGTGCDNMTAVIVKFRPDFKNVTDTIGDTGESIASVNENGKRSEPSEEDTELPASKKRKVDASSSEAVSASSQ